MHKGPEFNPRSCQSASRCRSTHAKNCFLDADRRGRAGRSERPYLDRDVLAVGGSGTTKLPSGKSPCRPSCPLCPAPQEKGISHSEGDNEWRWGTEYLHPFTRASRLEEFVRERTDSDNWQKVRQSGLNQVS